MPDTTTTETADTDILPSGYTVSIDLTMTLARIGSHLKVTGLIAEPASGVESTIGDGTIDLKVPNNTGSLRFRCPITLNGGLQIMAYTVTTTSQRVPWQQEGALWVTPRLNATSEKIEFCFEGRSHGASYTSGPSGTVIVRPPIFN